MEQEFLRFCFCLGQEQWKEIVYPGKEIDHYVEAEWILWKADLARALCELDKASFDALVIAYELKYKSTNS